VVKRRVASVGLGNNHMGTFSSAQHCAKCAEYRQSSVVCCQQGDQTAPVADTGARLACPSLAWSREECNNQRDLEEVSIFRI
jgi:hypothetical protein